MNGITKSEAEKGIKRGHPTFSNRNRTHENKRKYRRNSKRNQKSLREYR